MSGPHNLGIANDKHFELAKYEMDINYLAVIRLNNQFIEMLKSRQEGAARVNFTNPHAPLLLTSGSDDHTIPPS